MKILLVGANGTLGRAIHTLLAPHHDIVTVGRHSGTHQADLARPETLAALCAAVGPVDAIACAAGNVHFGPLAQMTAAQFQLGLQDKLLGQVQLALLGQRWLRDGGSVTLISGIVAHEPVRGGANASAVNTAIEGFVAAAAIEMPRGQRINAISPTVLTESLQGYGPLFPGFESVPAARVALAYQRSIEGAQTGRVYRVLP